MQHGYVLAEFKFTQRFLDSFVSRRISTSIELEEPERGISMTSHDDLFKLLFFTILCLDDPTSFTRRAFCRRSAADAHDVSGFGSLVQLRGWKPR